MIHISLCGIWTRGSSLAFYSNALLVQWLVLGSCLWVRPWVRYPADVLFFMDALSSIIQLKYLPMAQEWISYLANIWSELYYLIRPTLYTQAWNKCHFFNLFWSQRRPSKEPNSVCRRVFKATRKIPSARTYQPMHSRIPARHPV